MMKSKGQTISFGIFGIPELQNDLYKYATDKKRAAAMKKAGKTAMEYARKYAIMLCPVYKPSEDETNFNIDKITGGELKRSISKVKVKYNGVVISEKAFNKKGKIKDTAKSQLYVHIMAGNMKAGIDYAPRVEWGRNPYLMQIDYTTQDGILKTKYVYIPEAKPQPFMGKALTLTLDYMVNTFGKIYTQTLWKDVISRLSKKNKALNNKQVKDFIKQHKIKRG